MLGFIVGYLFAAFVGCWGTSLIVNEMWRCVGWEGPEHIELRPITWKWQPVLVGILERVLYIASLQFGYGEFIGVWLLVKIAARWSKWDKPVGSLNRQRRLEGYHIYQIFLIGNALSISFAAIGFLQINLVSEGKIVELVAASILPVLGVLCIKVWLKRFRLQ